ncbi:unnamed protein product [Debaryomyces tyrocola]|nr:unnamed protein product [Debaryomyces tyrocola]
MILFLNYWVIGLLNY